MMQDPYNKNIHKISMHPVVYFAFYIRFFLYKVHNLVVRSYTYIYHISKLYAIYFKMNIV